MKLSTPHKVVRHCQKELNCTDMWHRHQQAEFIRDVKPLICSFLLITCTNFSESKLIFSSEGTSQTVGHTAELNKYLTCIFVSQQK